MASSPPIYVLLICQKHLIRLTMYVVEADEYEMYHCRVYLENSPSECCACVTWHDCWSDMFTVNFGVLIVLSRQQQLNILWLWREQSSRHHNFTLSKTCGVERVVLSTLCTPQLLKEVVASFSTPQLFSVRRIGRKDWHLRATIH